MLKFDALQIENIIDKIVPLIAGEQDYEFFRGLLNCYAHECTSAAQFNSLIIKLLRAQNNEAAY